MGTLFLLTGMPVGHILVPTNAREHKHRLGVVVMAVQSIFEQTGWKRNLSMQLCQDREALLKFSGFDFDLYDRNFRMFLTSRGVGLPDGAAVYSERSRELNPTWVDKYPEQPLEAIKPYLDFYQCWTEEQVFNDVKCMKPAQSLTVEDRENWVLVWRLSRAKFQDAWELYRQV